MATKEKMTDKLTFTLSVRKILRSMGLKLLEKGVDYELKKPDLVAVYLDKKKYYIVEILSDECIETQARLNHKDSYEEVRGYFNKLFKNNPKKAAIASAIVCDLGYALEAFNYKSLGGFQLHFMTRYGAIATPNKYVAIVGEVLDYLKIEHGTLNILDKFTLILISKDFSERLSETKTFIKFILANK